MPQDLDLNALARFAAVVEHGGFSSAARALGQPRQSIHRSVAALEAEAGVRLLERTTRSVRLTAAGRRLHEHASSILRAAREARSSLVEARATPRGRLRLTAPHLFAEIFLAPALIEFLARWPDVQVDADLTLSPRDLVREDYDLAIRMGDVPDSSVTSSRLGEFEMVVCVAARLARRLRMPSPEALLHAPIVAYGAFSSPVWELARGSDSARVPVRPRLRVDSARIALDAAMAGLGVAMLPRFLAEPGLGRGTLVEAVRGWRPPPRTTWALYTGPAGGSPALRELLTTLRRHLAGRAR
jgi:DNA-binding transcriptional LysR family regulator